MTRTRCAECIRIRSEELGQPGLLYRLCVRMFFTVRPAVTMAGGTALCSRHLLSGDGHASS
jgi:hypothetical protein